MRITGWWGKNIWRDEDTYRWEQKHLNRAGRLIATGWSKTIERDEDKYRVGQEHEGITT